MGITVRIVDKRAAVVDHPKRAGIQPRTLELHHLLGTLPDILKRARPGPPKCSYGPNGRTPAHFISMFDVREPSPEVPWPDPLLLWQSAHEEILRDHLKEQGIEIEWGTELKGFEDSQDRVTVQLAKTMEVAEGVAETTSCQYLFGADGARSIIRKTLGLPFLRDTTDRVIVGVIQANNLSTDGIPGIQHSPEAQSNSFTMGVLGNKVDERFTGGREDIISAFVDVAGRSDIEFGEHMRTSVFIPHVRMVDQFSKGRCFVVGDAAHVHSPTGGQGLNTGFQDAVNVAWKLAAVIKGKAPASLLETYTVERLPVIAAMLNKTKLIHKSTLEGDEKALLWRRDGELQMLGINYRSSAIVVDTLHAAEVQAAVNAYRGGESLCAGDRAPQAPHLVDRGGREISLFDIFGIGHHTLLIFSAVITDEVRNCGCCLGLY